MQVWFKSDLRVDDHPGLLRASSAKKALPIFCFDPSLYRSLLRTPNGMQGTHPGWGKLFTVWLERQLGLS